MRTRHEAWVTTDHSKPGRASLNLTKARLGSFVQGLLSLGGTITDTFVMDSRYARSFVQMAVTLPAGMRGECERLTGIGLDEPPRAQPA